MKWFKIFIITWSALLLLFALSGLSIGFLVNRYVEKLAAKTVDGGENAVVEIPFGSSLRQISSILVQSHIIADAKQFYWYLRLGRRDGSKMQAGFYDFSGPSSYQTIADRLLSGRDQSWRVTFKEGQSLVDLALSLEGLGLTTRAQFLAAMTSDEVVNLIGAPDASKRHELENGMGGIEGYLFPDTYFFSKRDTALSIIKKMHQHFKVVIDDTIKKRLVENHESLHQILTLASIIEKETGDPKERPMIASVYRNRLKKGMRLQADPTVIYGVKDYKGALKKSDLLAYHPYNTYKISGLPPGPISSVSRQAIMAALWPLETNYYYFVSKNDGSHVFCEDLSCHNAAVKKWQIDYFKGARKER